MTHMCKHERLLFYKNGTVSMIKKTNVYQGSIFLIASSHLQGTDYHNYHKTFATKKFNHINATSRKKFPNTCALPTCAKKIQLFHEKYLCGFIKLAKFAKVFCRES